MLINELLQWLAIAALGLWVGVLVYDLHKFVAKNRMRWAEQRRLNYPDDYIEETD